MITDECKTHLCFEFISHAILCILYPYSCKTHKIFSKLGFVGLLMKTSDLARNEQYIFKRKVNQESHSAPLER